MFRFHCHFSILNYNPDTALLKRGFPLPVIKEDPMEYPISSTAKTPCPFPVTCQTPGDGREFCRIYFSAGREKRIMKEEPSHPAFHGCAPAGFYGRPFRALSLLYLYSPEKEENVPWKKICQCGSHAGAVSFFLKMPSRKFCFPGTAYLANFMSKAACSASFLVFP